MIRQPIVAVLGHVDHGKTTLLDKIRSTAVAAKEAGGITQAIGATEIPIDVIKKICGPLLKGIEIKIPGLLFLDTPGHEAFSALRRIGGSAADLAILVVDINEGIREQTKESIEFLKTFKTPFVVAATKIDRISGWISQEGKGFLESYNLQPEHVKQQLEEKLYELVGQLAEEGFDSERFDRVSDFRKTVAIVPCSGVTGEGIPELLMVLAGLSQTFLIDKLEMKGKTGYGTILEVKEVKGLGTVIDTIFYTGEIKRGDFLIIGGKDPKVTRIKAILKPKPLREIRVEKQFETVEKVTAACGVRIAAPDLEGVIAGVPIIVTDEKDKIEEYKEELKKDIALVEFETDKEGVIAKADTLGSLDALLHSLNRKNIPVRKAEVGAVSRTDVMIAEAQKDKYNRVILAFNVPIDKNAEIEAKNRGVKIFASPVIYKILEDFEKWIEEEKEKERKEKLAKLNRPAKIKILPGFVFRQSKPAIVGIEVLEGLLKKGVKLFKDTREIGYVKDIQVEGESKGSVEKGERAAVSIEGGVIGRNIKEGDILITEFRKEDLNLLKEFSDEISEEEIKLGEEIVSLLKK